MSFSLAFLTCNLSDAVREGVNPFTGEKVRAPVDVGLNPDEFATLFQALKVLNATGPDESGYHYAYLADEYVGIGAGDVNDSFPRRGFAVEVEGNLSVPIAEILWTLATAANVCISSSIEPDIIALTRQYTDQRVAERWPQAAYISSPVELYTWLARQLETGRIV